MSSKSKKIYIDVEFLGALKNINIENFDGDPDSPKPGRIWYDTKNNVLKAASIDNSIISLSTREDIISLINILKNNAVGQGSDVIGVPDLSNGDLSLASDKLTMILNNLLGFIDQNQKQINIIKTTFFEKDQVNQTDQDIEITDKTKGVILNDRSNGKKYRLYIDNGSLETEEV